MEEIKGGKKERKQTNKSDKMAEKCIIRHGCIITSMGISFCLHLQDLP
jgi:hypothetical protein